MHGCLRASKVSCAKIVVVCGRPNVFSNCNVHVRVSLDCVLNILVITNLVKKKHSNCDPHTIVPSARYRPDIKADTNNYNLKTLSWFAVMLHSFHSFESPFLIQIKSEFFLCL